MIPETQNACQATESTLTGQEVEDKTKCRPDEEAVTTITAWKRYQKFVELVESRGIEYNKKSTIEAMFRVVSIFDAQLPEEFNYILRHGYAQSCQ